MENHSIFTAAEIAEKIEEIGSGRRGKSKILVQKTGVLTYNAVRRRALPKYTFNPSGNLHRCAAPNFYDR
jgi:hypothetical protein